MLFRVMAPFYDHFVGRVGMDFREKLAQWMDPKPGEHLLDLGGGTGLNVPALVKRGAKVTLLDASKEMLEQARRKKISAELKLGDARRLPFPDGIFDGALCSDAWHHMTEQRQVAAELARVLRPGGKVVVLEFNRDIWQVKLLRLGEMLLGEPGTFMRPGELKRLFGEVGIEGEVRAVGSWQYVFVGKKRPG